MANPDYEFSIKFDPPSKNWVSTGPTGTVRARIKKGLVKDARDYCRAMRNSEGSTSMLTVFRKNGYIDFISTYGYRR